MTAEILRFLLAAYTAIAFAIAVSYLMRRNLTTFEFVVWSSMALVIPVFGPFFVIAARPGPRWMRSKKRR